MFVAADTSEGRAADKHGTLLSESNIERVYDYDGQTVVVVDDPGTYSKLCDVKCRSPRRLWALVQRLAPFVSGVVTGVLIGWPF